MGRFWTVLGAVALIGSATAANAGWTPVETPAPFGANTALLLTDGRVLMQDAGAKDWWILTPNDKGDYAKGSWTEVASLPFMNGAQYAPLYYASAVLPDGKVLVMGGEYNNGASAFTNDGALYDPVANTWTAVAPPGAGISRWRQIGDASSIILNDGTLMMANLGNTEMALFDEANLSWTVLPGTGKADGNDEEGWTLLRDGSILTVDTNNTADLTHSERLVGTTWQSAGETTAQLDDTTASGGGSHEIGPSVMRPNGTVIAFGATGHNSVYVPSTGKWTAAPDFPLLDGQQLDVADGPAAPLPDGHVLVAASPGVYNTPLEFLEFDGKTLTVRAGTPNAKDDSSYYGRMLVLPTGQILFTDFSSDVELYSSAGKPDPSWLPTVTSVPKVIKNGVTHTIKGTQFNGLTQGAAYGDDAQMATNFALVRVTSTASGNVSYCKTTNPSTMAIQTRSRVVSTHFTCEGVAKGAASLQVVTNGLASAAVAVTIE